jgi:UDP-GlcNAc:undecaprenyl-phosphate GlcNAc-1-phosphate transferase
LPDEARLIAAFVLALGAAFMATPVAMTVAARADFHDRPVGYKGHGQPTPYLGGAAVLGGFLIAAITLGGEFARLSPIVIGACVLWFLGTVDDRVGLPAWPRLAIEAVIAIALWSTGLGWDLTGSDAADLALTIVWVVGLVNAFNLMDNMDGAAATLAAVTAVTIGLLALIEGDAALAVLVFGLAGACVGFLPYNLATPARIFLGDGGSLPIGFVIAAALMVLPTGGELGFERLLAAVLVAGLPVLDTALVTISRRRAGVSVISGGRDHLTHRLATRIGPARTVALTLGITQAGLGAVAIGVVQLGRGSVLVAWSIWFVVATAAITLLETRSWAPTREPVDVPKAVAARAPRGRRRFEPSLVEVLVIAFISVSCGLSPFVSGFYDVSVWGPIALGLLAALMGLLIARPAAPRRGALVAAGALTAIWLFALLSTAWAESADQAMTEANRWLLYAALFGLLILLLRDDRLGAVVIGAATAAVGVFGGYLFVRMMAGSASELFIGGRLHGPLGYVNGQAAYLLAGLWPLIALAERAKRPLVGGTALAGATALAGLALMGQTRAVLPALVVSVALLLAVLPGRTRRAWALACVAGGVAICLGPVLEVYDSVGGARRPVDSVIREAAVAIVLAAVVAGGAWAAIASLAPTIRRRFGECGARRAAWAPLALVALLAVTVAAASLDNPVERVRAEYRSFVELDSDSVDSARFTTGAGNRYDYWRVAWNQFADEPLRGIGAGNYDRTYYLERRTTEDIRQPHSLELQILGELGLVGGGLLAFFLLAVLGGFARRVRTAGANPRARVLAVAAGGTFVVWLVHTSVDWLHLIPGLTGIALCSAAVLVGPWTQPRGSRSSRRRTFVVAACAVLALVGAVLVGRAALAERYLQEGRDALDGNPTSALAKASDSLRLNDEALPAYYLRSAAWAQLGDYERARAALTEATRREPHDFVPWTLLGDLATRRGDDRQAARDYGRAHQLNPEDRTIATLRDQASRRASRAQLP